MSITSYETELSDWFGSRLGQYVYDSEKRIIDSMIADVFGYNAVQIGLPELDYLSTSRVSNKFVLSSTDRGALKALPELVPIRSSSVDLIVMPHAIENSQSPHDLVREAERVLLPGGVIIFSGFNPHSMWGIMNAAISMSKISAPWVGKYLTIRRLKDWCKLLSIELDAGRMCCYRPPIQSNRVMHRLAPLESIGDRWFPMFAGVYVVKGVKCVSGMRLVMDSFKRPRVSRYATQVAQRHVAKVIPFRKVDS